MNKVIPNLYRQHAFLIANRPRTQYVENILFKTNKLQFSIISKSHFSRFWILKVFSNQIQTISFLFIFHNNLNSEVKTWGKFGIRFSFFMWKHVVNSSEGKIFLSSPSACRTSGASKNRDWPDENGTIFLCSFGITWCSFLGVPC